MIQILFDYILDALSDGICEVVFIKKTDGSVRKINCTHSTKYIPRGIIKKIRKARSSAHDDGLIAVWDIDAHEWKSFYYSSIRYFDKKEEKDSN